MFSRDSMSGATSWQLILADLSLILFLVAAAALADDLDDTDEPAVPRPAADVPAQGVYRPRLGGPSITRWLEQQSPDPRMTLTVVATHRADKAKEGWEEANALASEARSQGLETRIILREGAVRDLYASLGYDALE